MMSENTVPEVETLKRSLNVCMKTLEYLSQVKLMTPYEYTKIQDTLNLVTRHNVGERIEHGNHSSDLSMGDRE